MRLMLGVGSDPELLVEVTGQIDHNSFDFYTVNGNWDGTFHGNGRITVCDAPSGAFSSLVPLSIICDEQDRLRGDWTDVFDNFDIPAYVAPRSKVVFDDLDDDVPF